MSESENELGPNLRELRERQQISLRKIARDTGINSGYLSQLERGEVSQPGPSMLNRLAEAYGVPAEALLAWAGYGNPATELSPTQALALKHLGPNPSSEEVEAIRAVLDVLRSGRATSSAAHHHDLPLDPAEKELIREHALALLREADALGVTPTPLDQLTDVAKLVYAGEIELTLEEKRSLRRSLGNAFDRVLHSVEGLLSFGAGEIWLKPDLYPTRRSFVHAHELGHHILPMHRQIAYLDNRDTLYRDLHDACEREANQAAIDLLAQGDALRRFVDDSPISFQGLDDAARRFGISLEATARYVGEESRQECCVAIYYRGQDVLVAPHVYSSSAFEKRFGWLSGQFPANAVSVTLREAALARNQRGLIAADARDRLYTLQCEAVNTPRALIGLVVRNQPSGTLGRSFHFRR